MLWRIGEPVWLLTRNFSNFKDYFTLHACWFGGCECNRPLYMQHVLIWNCICSACASQRLWWNVQHFCANFIWFNHPYIHIRSAINLYIGHNVHALIVFVQPLCFVASYYWAGFEIAAVITRAPWSADVRSLRYCTVHSSYNYCVSELIHCHSVYLIQLFGTGLCLSRHVKACSVGLNLQN
jgi:hypothetical protein